MSTQPATAPVGWGILGTGAIAAKFASDLARVPASRLAAVGSRRRDTAEAFAAAHAVPVAFDSYEALVQCPAVDVVYVVTPHSCHRPNTLLALDAGKAVLCEKPFALTAGEAAEMIAAARQRRLFLMEAMWTRCFPLMDRLHHWINTGVLGDLRMLTADFGYRAEPAEKPRLFDPGLGGGALLDVGVYPIALAWNLFGPPHTVASQACLATPNVDESCSILFHHANGALALLSASMGVDTAKEAVLCGTRAAARLPCPWWKPSVLILSREGTDIEIVREPFAGFGYQYEILEVLRCLHHGLLESPRMPLDESLAIMRALDTLRAQWVTSPTQDRRTRNELRHEML